MSKIRCLCDEVIWLGQIPSPHQLMIISDVEMDKLGEHVEMDILYQKTDLVVKCPNCGRLHVFWDGFDKAQKIYKPEKF